MRFLGTGSAEMYPNPYCDCDVCQRARENKEQPRLRSAFRIDDRNMIDFGPDILAASLLFDEPLSMLDTVFITHTHDDHFCVPNICMMTLTNKRKGHMPIRFYLSKGGVQWVNDYNRAVRPLYSYQPGMEALCESNAIELCPVTPYEWFEAGGMRVFAVESNHCISQRELALNYLFCLPDRRKLLYVLDSGLYSEKNLVALEGQKAEMLIMEGTFGSMPVERDCSHLNAEHFIEQVHTFRERGIIAQDAQVWVTHISQVNTFDHAAYQQYVHSMSDMNIAIAHDGLVVG